MTLFGPEEKIEISQLEIAVKQLATAVQIYFAEGDQVSIHSLLRNAEEILSGLLKDKGKQSLWNVNLDMIKPEYRDEFRKEMDKPRNIFKHRVHVESQKVVLKPRLNEYFMMVGVNAVHTEFPDFFTANPELMVAEAWFRCHSPDIFMDRISAFEEDKHLSKEEFYTKHLKTAKAYIQAGRKV